jgi:hypothetical protein
VEAGRLQFDDLGAVYGFHQARTCSLAWSVYDNQAGTKTPVAGATGPEIPRSDAAYLAADIHAGDPSKTVTVYVRRAGGKTEVVGVDRKW